MTYRFSREENEDVIRKLAEKYPKCFFVDPRQRRPLKKNILADLQNDGFPAAYEPMSAAIEWYMSHFSYRYALEAGAKRVDLNGKEVGTVTEQETSLLRRKTETTIKSWPKEINSTPPERRPCRRAYSRRPTEEIGCSTYVSSQAAESGRINTCAGTYPRL